LAGHRDQRDAEESALRQAIRRHDTALGILGQPESVIRRFDFWDDSYEWRRLFSEVLGTFFLALVAAGGAMVNARFGGYAIPVPAQVVAPGLMVMAIILFMGTVSGAHLNPRSASRSRSGETSRGSAFRPTSSPSWPARCSPLCCCGH
jgi:Major intrinsic protein